MAAELEELERKLLDRATPMPVRFRALFALRGLGGDAVRAAFADGASLSFGATSSLSHARKRQRGCRLARLLAYAGVHMARTSLHGGAARRLERLRWTSAAATSTPGD